MPHQTTTAAAAAAPAQGRLVPYQGTEALVVAMGDVMGHALARVSEVYGWVNREDDLEAIKHSNEEFIAMYDYRVVCSDVELAFKAMSEHTQSCIRQEVLEWFELLAPTG